MASVPTILPGSGSLEVVCISTGCHQVSALASPLGGPSLQARPKGAYSLPAGNPLLETAIRREPPIFHSPV
jgi:hypothetical protein